jgi:hypothetical protein
MLIRTEEALKSLWGGIRMQRKQTAKVIAYAYIFRE